ncbi:MAG: 50S ribosomal protein L18 [bacterium]|nr:50S ribosomal protein L18 [bacterium]
MIKTKREKKIARHKRVRAKIKGTADSPRLSVFRSNKHVWAQLIDDESGSTIVSAGDLQLSEAKSKTKTKKVELARRLGGVVAQKAKEKKIEKIVFDRGGYKYHGIVKALAEGAREGGLKF